jgi:SPP1 gp7 family putative phage head morphogenesis protein
MNIKRGKSIKNNVAIRKRYENALEQIVLQMRRDTEAEVKRLFRNDYTIDEKQQSISTKTKLALAALFLKFKLQFTKVGKKASVDMIKASNQYTSSAVRFSLEELTGEKRPNMIQLLRSGEATRQAALNENASLLTSIPSHYYTVVMSILMQAISTGLKEKVEQDVEKQGDVVERRTKLIAIDQTNKVTQALAIRKMKSQGLKRFEWVYTYRSKEPRLYHIHRDKKIYRFDEPPGGEYPGSPINCKCIARPVIEQE